MHELTQNKYDNALLSKKKKSIIMLSNNDINMQNWAIINAHHLAYLTRKLKKKKKPFYLEKCYVHNIFTTNPKWQVVIGCYC